MFTFVVGTNRDNFSIHADLVASLSPKLHAMIHSGMKESHEKTVDWSSESLETFCSFGEFAYHGSYDVIAPKLRAADQALSPEQERGRELQKEARDQKHSEHPKPPSSSKSGSSTSYLPKMERLFESFVNLYPPVPQAKPKSRYTHPDDDYTDVFLAHARVYIFAEYHDIDDLKRLSLENLSQLLAQFQVFNHTAQEFVELAKFTFDNPVANHDELKAIVVLFSACNIKCLNRNEDFKKLLSSPGFASQLFDLVMD